MDVSTVKLIVLHVSILIIVAHVSMDNTYLIVLLSILPLVYLHVLPLITLIVLDGVSNVLALVSFAPILHHALNVLLDTLYPMVYASTQLTTHVLLIALNAVEDYAINAYLLICY